MAAGSDGANKVVMQSAMAGADQAMAKRRRWTWAVVVTLLLAGFALRMWDLMGAPPGDDDDEMYYAMDAVRVAQFGQFEIYYPTNYGH